MLILFVKYAKAMHGRPILGTRIKRQQVNNRKNIQDSMGGGRKLARLRAQLEQAKVLYHGAERDYDRAVERMHDLGNTHPDGGVQHAVRLVTHTLRNYSFAIEQYNRFVLDQTPERLEWLQGKKKPPTQI